MQHFPVYNEVSSSAQHRVVRRPRSRQIAGSRSLASMLPSLLSSGLLTLILTAVLRVLWTGYQTEFFSVWMEAWLTTWPIAFPLVYISIPVMKKLTRHCNTVSDVNASGLHASDIRSVSDQVSRQNRLKRRSLSPSSDIC